MTEKKVQIDGLGINYKEEGGGEPLLVLHGWGGSTDSWIKVQEILANSAFKVVMPDWPGFGKSAAPREPWGVNEYTDFILKFANELNLNSFYLLGHSFGGRISIRFAINYPEKVQKLILCDSAGIKPVPSFKTRLIFLFARIGNAIFTPAPLARFKDSARNFFYGFMRHKDYTKTKGVMRETLKKVVAEDLSPDLPKIQTKTLLIWGDMDRLVPVKYASMFKEKIRNSDLVILPGIGHSPNLEVPEGLSEIIIKFLKEN